MKTFRYTFQLLFVLTAFAFALCASQARAQVGTYCASAATDPAGLDITDVGFACNGYAMACSLLAPGPASALNLYGNFTSIGPFTAVIRGDSAHFSVQTMTCDLTDDSATLAMFADWNQDNDFQDANETVYQQSKSINDFGFEGYVTIPSDALLGPTGFRVVVIHNDGSSISPCGSYGQGETEDYIIYVNDSIPGGIVAVTPNAPVVCTGDAVMLSASGLPAWTPAWSPIALQWQTSFDGATWTNAVLGNFSVFTLDSVVQTTYVRLQWYNSIGCIGFVYSDTAIVQVAATPVITFTNPTPTTVTVNWTPATTADVSWVGSGVTGGWLDATSPLEITGLPPGVGLCVTVIPESTCIGVDSTEACTTPLCTPPTDVVVTSPADNALLVTWIDVPWATSHRVYYKDLTAGDTVWSYVDTTGANTKTLTGINGCHEYAVKVAAINCPSAGAVGQFSPQFNWFVLPCSNACAPVPTVTAIYINVTEDLVVNLIGGTGPWVVDVDFGDGSTLQDTITTGFVTYPHTYADTTINYTICVVTYGICGAQLSLPSNTTCPAVNFVCPTISVTGTSTSPTCGLANGNIDLNVTGGALPLTYVWSNGATTQNLGFVYDGAYCVTVTDMNGCTAEQCFTLTSGNPLVLSSTVISGMFGSSIDLSVSGGAAPYAYMWNSGSTDEDLVNVVSGPFCVTVSDMNGCLASVCDTVFAQYVIVEGMLTNTDSFPVLVTLTADSFTFTTVYTDATGYFTDTIAINTTQPFVIMSFEDCTGVTQTGVALSNPGTIYVSFAPMNWCPDTGTFVMLNVQLNFTGGTPVDITVDTDSLDYTLTTNASGFASTLLQVVFLSSPVTLSFVNCDGDTQIAVLYPNPATFAINYTGVYCDSVWSGQTVTITGMLLHTDSVPVFVTLQTAGDYEQLYTDSAGNFSAVMFSLDTLIYVEMTFTDCYSVGFWNFYTTSSNQLQIVEDYCPTNPIDTCAALYTASYDVSNNVFLLEMDSLTQSIAYDYYWDFGDGTASVDQFPTHTYTISALYNVCLYLSDSSGSFCFYCHTIGIDSIGNIVTRQDEDGFTINVIPFGTVQGWQTLPEQSFELYPNPVDDVSTIKLYSDAERNYAINVYNAVGQRVYALKADVNKGANYVQVPMKNLVPGMYLMTVDFGNKTVSRSFAK